MIETLQNLLSDLFSGGMTLVSVAITVAIVVGVWKMFEKAGQPGWVALVPFYNAYKLCEISIGNGWLFLLAFAGIIPLIGWIAAIGLEVMIGLCLAKAFGQEPVFAIGLILLPPVFYCILGFGSAYYYGPQGMHFTGEEATTVDFEVEKNDR